MYVYVCADWCTALYSFSLSLSLPIVRVLGHSVLTSIQTLGVSTAGVVLVALTARHTAYAVSVIVQRADSAAGVFQKDDPIHTYAEEELLLVPSDESNPASEYSTAYSSPAYLTACSSMDTSAYPSCDSSRANSPRSQEKVKHTHA